MKISDFDYYPLPGHGEYRTEPVAHKFSSLDIADGCGEGVAVLVAEHRPVASAGVWGSMEHH